MEKNSESNKQDMFAYITPPTVSIIVPVYNVKKYLPACIESILTQNYNHFEVILVDDGSSDKSDIICDKYSEKYHNIFVVHQPNAGLSAARNCGIKKAKGDFIMFIDSDDELENPDLISDNIMLFDDTIDIVQFPIRKIFVNSSRSEFLCDCQGNIATEQEYLLNLLPLYRQNKINGSACNKIFRRKVFEEVKFREGILHEDSVFMLDISDRFYKIKFSDIGYYDYYIRENTINTAKHSFKWYHDYLNMQLYYCQRSLEDEIFQDIEFNNRITLINTLRIAYKDLSHLEFDKLLKEVEKTLPNYKQLSKYFRRKFFQALKILVAKFFGMKFLIKILAIR